MSELGAPNGLACTVGRNEKFIGPYHHQICASSPARNFQALKYLRPNPDVTISVEIQVHVYRQATLRTSSEPAYRFTFLLLWCGVPIIVAYVPQWGRNSQAHSSEVSPRPGSQVTRMPCVVLIEVYLDRLYFWNARDVDPCFGYILTGSVRGLRSALPH